MEKILSGYTVDDATWFYLSLFLTVTVYFRFSRVFSLRNLDLLLLLAISPGILLVRHGSASGYVWLFGLSGVLLLRLVADRYFTRRPRLDQNLNSQGLSFLGAVAFLFLAATAWNLRQLPNSTVQTVEAANRLSKRQEAPKNRPRPPQRRPTPRRDPERLSWRSRLSSCRNWRSPPSIRRRKRRARRTTMPSMRPVWRRSWRTWPSCWPSSLSGAGISATSRSGSPWGRSICSCPARRTTWPG